MLTNSNVIEKIKTTIAASHDQHFLVIKRNNKKITARCKFSLCRSDQLPLHGIVLSKQIKPFDRAYHAAVIYLSAKSVDLAVYIAGTGPLFLNTKAGLAFPLVGAYL